MNRAKTGVNRRTIDTDGPATCQNRAAIDTNLRAIPPNRRAIYISRSAIHISREPFFTGGRTIDLPAAQPKPCRNVCRLSGLAVEYGVMTTAVRFLIFLMLSISMSMAVIPLQSAVPEIVKSGCCARMKMDDQQNDCGKEMPKSQQDRQCCAACTVGLALFLNASNVLIAPPAADEWLVTFVLHQQARSDRPLVPPPRQANA